MKEEIKINPLLRKLGFADDDRVVIFHADDIGMCQASLAAYEELLEFGLMSSAAVMVPCSWFPATAVYCRDNQKTNPYLDMGVHLTLTSEFDSYRWGPLSNREASTGLLDDAGYFHRVCAPVQADGQLDAVEQELAAQIEHALAAGIDITHIDSHMGCLFHPRFLPIYLKLAQKYRLPALMLRPSAIDPHAVEFPETETFEAFSTTLYQLEKMGYPLLDSVEIMSLDQSQNRLEEARTRLDGLDAGVHYFIFHPSTNTPEIRAIAPDWRSREADYQLFTNKTWQEILTASGVKVIGWRILRDLMRGE